MKKSIALLLSLAMVLALFAGCGGSTEAPAPASAEAPAAESAEAAASAAVEEAAGSGDVHKIGIITYYVNSSFESSYNTAAQKRCEELGLEYESFDANQDMGAYQTCFENAINAGVDAIVCVPSDPTAMGPQCEVCEEAGVYLVVMAVAPAGYYSTAIVVDNSVKGALKAQNIVDACGDGCRVLMLLGNQQQTGWVEENDAAKAVFAEHNCEIVAEEDPQAAMDTAMGYMETWLSQGLEFDALWCQSDTVAAGACAALDQAGYDYSKIYIASEDGDETGLKLVKEGKIDSTLSLPGTSFANSCVNAAYEWLTNGTYDTEVPVDMAVVTIDNVDEYLEG